ncbi:MAG: hypothetical protein ACI86C_001334 [Candidatus Latescibacterota bacterium]|jgi:hypothetical protein
MHAAEYAHAKKQLPATVILEFAIDGCIFTVWK